MPKNLRNIRKNMGYTLKSLSEESGIGVSTIGNYETGKTEMSEESLKKIASILKVTTEELSRTERLKSPGRHSETVTDPDTQHATRSPKEKYLEQRVADLEDQYSHISKMLSELQKGQKEILQFASEKFIYPQTSSTAGKVVKESSSKNVLRFPARCLGSVAAGTPSQDEAQTIVMLDTPLPCDNYLLRVSGASMEPDIPDGSYIEVEDFRGKGFPKKGSIVVYADGTGATLKQFTTKRDDDGNRQGVLRSINPEYPEVQPLEDGTIQAIYVRTLE
ncbi:helix-turn-helix domain-containing protein [Kiritimatiellaeota bacterium B1221]|nr:helix-turn-helix domain-containing protein [Kiritimatiellaeota bacterium B1221]